jgi:hypothetical protein
MKAYADTIPAISSCISDKRPFYLVPVEAFAFAIELRSL